MVSGSKRRSWLVMGLLLALITTGCGGKTETPPPSNPVPPAPPTSNPNPPSPPVTTPDVPSEKPGDFAQGLMKLRYMGMSLGDKVASNVTLPPTLSNPRLVQYHVAQADVVSGQARAKVVVNLWWSEGAGSAQPVVREEWTLGPVGGHWQVQGVATSETCRLLIKSDGLYVRKGDREGLAIALANLPAEAPPAGGADKFGVARGGFGAAALAADCQAAAFVTKGGGGHAFAAWVVAQDDKWQLVPLDLYFEGGAQGVYVSPDGQHVMVLTTPPSGAYGLALYTRAGEKLPLGNPPKTPGEPGMMQPPTQLHWVGNEFRFTFDGKTYKVVPGNPAQVSPVD